MALALALVFTLVPCCLPVSASSVSSREEFYPLSPFNTKSMQSKYIEVCQSCAANGDCESKMQKFCTLPLSYCYLKLPILTRDCKIYACEYSYECSEVWESAFCYSSKCYCNSKKYCNFAAQTCDYQDFENKQSTPKSTDNTFDWTTFAIVFPNVLVVFISIICAVCICVYRMRRRNQAVRVGHSRPVGAFALTGTISTVGLLGTLPDERPGYTNAYTTPPPERYGQQNYNLPTYEEAVRPSEWNSPSLFGVAAPSSGQERNTPLTPGYHVESSESDGYINRGYVNFTSRS